MPRDDDTIERLARLFLEHPAWVAAAKHLAPEATSTVHFRERPSEPLRLERREGSTRLLPGASPDPDFVFLFTPRAVERLEAVRGGVGDFAVALFELITDEDPDARVGFRVAADFSRLRRRGYVRLLIAAGPRLLAFGAARGVRTLGALRRLVEDLRARGPADWEGAGADDPARGQHGAEAGR